VDAGDVVVESERVGVAKKAIAASAQGALAISGVFDFEREQDTAFSDGDDAYWDEDGTPEGGAATGAAVSTSDGGTNKYIGKVVGDVADAAANLTVRIAMSPGWAQDSTALGDLSDVGDGAPGNAELLISDADSWEAKSVSGAVTMDNAGVFTMNSALGDLTDVGDGAPGDAELLISDADSWEAKSMSGDATIDNAGAVTLNAAHSEQHTQISVEDLGAGADIATREVFVHPRAVTLKSVGILTDGAPAGVDDGNTMVVTLADDAANTIVTKTYNAGTQPPTSDYEDLGALDGTHKVLAAGEHVTLSVTNGATANPPAFLIILVWEPTNA